MAINHQHPAWPKGFTADNARDGHSLQRSLNPAVRVECCVVEDEPGIGVTNQPENSARLLSSGYLHPTARFSSYTVPRINELLEAIEHNREDKVCQLIADGIDVNESGSMGRTPLYQAAHYNRSRIATILLQAGASADSTGSFGETALYHAAEQDSVDVMKVLLQAGANPHTKSHVGRTPLHHVAAYGQTHSAELLIHYHADIHCRDGMQRTPLHWAANNNHPQIVRLMLESGANPLLTDKNGDTPLFMAELKGHAAVVHEIRQFLRKQRKGCSSFFSLLCILVSSLMLIFSLR